MQVKLPDSVLNLSPGQLWVGLVNDEVVLVVRETEWGLKKYPAQCPAELKLRTWDMGQAVVVVLLLRLGCSDVTTYEFWLDPATPVGVRMMQELGAQTHVHAHLFTDQVARSFWINNDVRYDASMVLNTMHSRRIWPPAAYQSALGRLYQLYPTAGHLWRSDL